MTAKTVQYTVCVAFSDGAFISSHSTHLVIEEVRLFDDLLRSLSRLGHVAAFSIVPTAGFVDRGEVINFLRRRCGSFVVDAVLAADPLPSSPDPAYLMPVWPFDHEVEGAPATTARFLSLDLGVIAASSPDEEQGVTLPQRSGRWLIEARPILF